MSAEDRHLVERVNQDAVYLFKLAALGKRRGCALAFQLRRLSLERSGDVERGQEVVQSLYVVEYG